MNLARSVDSPAVMNGREKWGRMTAKRRRKVVSIDSGRDYKRVSSLNLSTEAYEPDKEETEESNVYILTGRKRWWADRRFRMWIAVALGIGLLIGFVVGTITALLYGHETLVRSGETYKELIQRGDAAMHLLSITANKLESLGQGKRVVLASDLQEVKSTLGIMPTGERR